MYPLPLDSTVIEPGISPLVWLVALLPLLSLALVALIVLRRHRRCAHCGRPWGGRRVAVAEVVEVRSCIRCRASLVRRGTQVRLCPDCFAGHRAWNRGAARAKVHGARG